MGKSLYQFQTYFGIISIQAQENESKPNFVHFWNINYFENY